MQKKESQFYEKQKVLSLFEQKRSTETTVVHHEPAIFMTFVLFGILVWILTCVVSLWSA